MSISFVGAQGAAATTVTIPAHQSGDMIFIFAYRDGNNTAPTTPTAGGTVPTWVSIGSSGANTNSSSFSYVVATASTTTSGTWANATELICLVYRGTKLIGANAGGSGTATTTVNYPALTMQRTDNSSWVVGVAGHRTATNVEVAPTGMTNRAFAGTEAAGHDTNGTVTSWASTNVTVNASSAFRSWTVELRDATVVLTAAAGSLTETGRQATLTKARTLTAATGTFTNTGNSATLTKTANPNKLLTADIGAFVETGVAATLKHAALITAGKATFSEVGIAASLRHNVVLVAAKGAFTETGVPATITQTAILVSAKGTYSFTGNEAALSKQYKLVAASRAFNVTGNSASVIYSGMTTTQKKAYYQVQEIAPRKSLINTQPCNGQVVYYVNDYLRIL